jgi:hypothetical protein
MRQPLRYARRSVIRLDRRGARTARYAHTRRRDGRPLEHGYRIAYIQADVIG